MVLLEGATGIFGCFNGPGTFAVVGLTGLIAGWRYLQQVVTINNIAANTAEEDTWQFFETAIQDDPSFRRLTFQWQKLYSSCFCCNSTCCICQLKCSKDRATRLRVAVRRVLIDGIPLPPVGPPLIPGDAAPAQVHTPVHRRLLEEQRAPFSNDVVRDSHIGEMLLREQERAQSEREHADREVAGALRREQTLRQKSAQVRAEAAQATERATQLQAEAARQERAARQAIEVLSDATNEAGGSDRFRASSPQTSLSTRRAPDLRQTQDRRYSKGRRQSQEAGPSQGGPPSNETRAGVQASQAHETASDNQATTSSQAAFLDVLDTYGMELGLLAQGWTKVDTPEQRSARSQTGSPRAASLGRRIASDTVASPQLGVSGSQTGAARAATPGRCTNSDGDASPAGLRIPDEFATLRRSVSTGEDTLPRPSSSRYHRASSDRGVTSERDSDRDLSPRHHSASSGRGVTSERDSDRDLYPRHHSASSGRGVTSERDSDRDLYPRHHSASSGRGVNPDRDSSPRQASPLRRALPQDQAESSVSASLRGSPLRRSSPQDHTQTMNPAIPGEGGITFRQGSPLSRAPAQGQAAKPAQTASQARIAVRYTTADVLKKADDALQENSAVTSQAQDTIAASSPRVRGAAWFTSSTPGGSRGSSAAQSPSSTPRSAGSPVRGSPRGPAGSSATQNPNSSAPTAGLPFRGFPQSPGRSFTPPTTESMRR